MSIPYALRRETHSSLWTAKMAPGTGLLAASPLNVAVSESELMVDRYCTLPYKSMGRT